MNNVKCDSMLNSFKLVRKGEDIYWVLQIKVVEDTSIRTFTRQFGSDIDFNGAFDQSAVNDAWNKANFPLTDYNLEYMFTFDELRFPAKLVNLSATRKCSKDDTWSTEYILNLIADPDKDEIKKLAYFVKHKEEDPETGKKVLMTYNTALEDPKLYEDPISAQNENV